MALRIRQPLLAEAAASGDSIAIDKADLTLTGANLGQSETQAISVATLTLSGASLGAADSTPITAASLTLTGAVLGGIDGEAASITAATLTLTGGSIGGAETQAITPATLSLTGAAIGTGEATPAPALNRAKGGGSGLGPASPAAITANEAHERKKRDRWRRIEATIEGRQPEQQEPAPAPQQKSSKPLPEPTAETPQVNPFDALVAAIMAESIPSFIVRDEIRFYDPDEDAAVLMLLG